MKYLADTVIKDRKDGRIKDEHGEDMTLKGAINYLWNNYRPNPQGLTLLPAELRNFEKALDALDENPDADGYWPLDNDYYAVLLRAVPVMAATNLFIAKWSPSIEDSLKAAVDKKPEKEKEADSEGTVDEVVPEKSKKKKNG